MFLLNWFYGVLAQLGLYRKNAKILFLGLDNAGKTTLLHMLKENRVQVHTPTLHPNQDELIMGQIRFRAFDLGGHQPARKLWKEYFPTIDAVVFLVDAYDHTRFEEARRELDSLLISEELASKPFLVLGNKIDIAQAASEDNLRYALGLTDTTGKEVTERRGDDRPVEVFMCSVVRKMGYADGFRWLANFL